MFMFGLTLVKSCGCVKFATSWVLGLGGWGLGWAVVLKFKIKTSLSNIDLHGNFHPYLKPVLVCGGSTLPKNLT